MNLIKRITNLFRSTVTADKYIKSRNEVCMARKTISIESLVKSFNEILKDPDMLELQKEVVCGICEGILERSKVTYKIQKFADTEYSREYKI